MKSLKISATIALASLTLAGCAATQQEATGPTVISYDHGALDTLLELGVEDKVLAIPHRGLPDYLAHFGDELPDAGTLKVPDLQEIQALQPELVLMTSRQGEAMEAVAGISRVKDVTLPAGEYRESVSSMALELGGLYDREDLASHKLDALWQHVADQKAKVADAGKVTVVTHNEGNYSLRMEPAIYELLELEPAAVPDAVESVTHGARTFYPVDAETLSEMAPDTLFVVDRSAAIGAEPLEQETLQNAVDSTGVDSKVVLLNPGLWYLSGGGLQSVRLQVDEVVNALQ